MDELEGLPSRSLEDCWRIARRRRWWILLCIFVCWVLFWGVGWLLPSTYRSEALIVVEQQKVPEHYVVPNITLSLQDRLHSITQQILSRTRLQAAIDRFHLYARHGGPKSVLDLDDPVEQMRKDIQIEFVESPGHPGELTAFKIDYSASSPELAQQVNSELTSLFIGENLKSQQQQSESTTEFLRSQLANARIQLEEQEAKVRAFKVKHFGFLPGQMESNIQILIGLQTQLDNHQRALDAAKQQRLYLQSLLQMSQTIGNGQKSVDFSGISPEGLDIELQDLRTRLADARSRYTEAFPDVVSLKHKIEETEKLRNQMEARAFRDPNSNDAQSTAGGDTNIEGREKLSAPMKQARSQLKANDLEIQNSQRHINETEAQIATYRSRLNLTPAIEAELADISRGYEESKSNYNSLLQKQNQSQLATSLEQRQQGEQFLIIDPPSLPSKPSSPKRLRMSLLGLALGAGIGLGLAVVLEFLNPQVWQEEDLEGIVPGRVLTAIPRLNTPAESRFMMLRRRLELGVAFLIGLAITLANLYTFYKG